MNDLNQKHHFKKSNNQFDCKKIEFLDTLVCIQQLSFLNTKSEHPCSLKKVFHIAKHFKFKEYVQYLKPTIVTLKNVLKNLLIKDTNETLPFNKLRKLINQIKSNFSTNKCVIINNVSGAYSCVLPNPIDILTKH